MPTPVSPVIKGLEDQEIIFGAQQEEYIPLPALRSPDGKVMSRWHLTDEERESIAQGADVILTVWVFDKPMAPVHIAVPSCSMDLTELARQMGMFDYVASPLPHNPRRVITPCPECGAEESEPHTNGGPCERNT